MYIISKKKDYYDGVVGTMGVDKTIVYERTPVIDDDRFKFPKPFTAIRGWNDRDRTPFSNIRSGYPVKRESMYDSGSAFIVGFCGKLYLGWKFYLEVLKDKHILSYPELRTSITYDVEFIKKHLEKTSWRGKLIDDINYISSYNPMDLFRQLNVPIFIYDSDYDRKFLGTYTRKGNEVFITNPPLKDYEFYKVQDSFAAFQEIQTFMGGVLGTGEKEIVEIEDKYKISQHGFDNKSFRRDKANGKKRPQSNR